MLVTSGRNRATEELLLLEWIFELLERVDLQAVELLLKHFRSEGRLAGCLWGQGRT